MSTPRWIEWVLQVPRDEAEPWADAFLAAGALSVQAEDADVDTPDEQPRFGEPGMAVPDGAVPFGWQRTTLTVLVDADAASGPLDEAAGALQQPLPAVTGRRDVADQDWVRATQAQFPPIPVGRRLIIVPSWHAGTDDAGRLRLVVDPGLAFGTGSHPTTRMCLEWLDAHDLSGLRLIDYGCGSGILAIAAARLGAGDVLALDIDPQAVISTRHNAQANDVRLHAASSTGATPGPADVVVANILSSPLKLLAPLLVSLVRPGGRLVLAGVLERQADEVAACYAPHVVLQPWRTLDGWTCLAGTRAADGSEAGAGPRRDAGGPSPSTAAGTSRPVPDA